MQKAICGEASSFVSSQHLTKVRADGHLVFLDLSSCLEKPRFANPFSSTAVGLCFSLIFWALSGTLLSSINPLCYLEENATGMPNSSGT
jgi:hypothetical protein